MNMLLTLLPTQMIKEYLEWKLKQIDKKYIFSYIYIQLIIGLQEGDKKEYKLSEN